MGSTFLSLCEHLNQILLSFSCEQCGVKTEQFEKQVVQPLSHLKKCKHLLMCSICTLLGAEI